jgi:peptide/nickel transport system permease protein
MLSYTIKRLALAVLVAFTVSLLAFFLVRLSGDVATAIGGPSATAQDIEQIRKQYGLDRPLIVQYLEWFSGALAGDFGESFYFKQPVSVVLSSRLPVTIILGCSALAFALLLAVPMGVLAAVRPNSWIDRLALTVSVLGQALPSFWFALLLILFFGVTLRWLPISGNETWAHFVMPSIALGYYGTPAIMRLTRAGMLEVLESDYIRTARAKGLRTHTVLIGHALRNAIIPVVSLTAVQFGFLLGGSIVIETVFALQGMGHLAWSSISRADVMVVQALVLVLALFYVVLTLAADLLNAYLDPRIRIGG